LFDGHDGNLQSRRLCVQGGILSDARRHHGRRVVLTEMTEGGSTRRITIPVQFPGAGQARADHGRGRTVTKLGKTRPSVFVEGRVLRGMARRLPLPDQSAGWFETARR